MEDGYDQEFLGVTVELPKFDAGLQKAVVPIDDADSSFYRDYIHYSVATHAEKRWPVVAALNIDQSSLKSTQRKSWRKDKPVGYVNQLGTEYYDHNRWDKGHVGSRAGAAWGKQTIAQLASDSTMYYSNSALQLDNFNRREWKELEDWLRNDQVVPNKKISVFSGPISGDDPVFVVPELQREPDQEKLPAEIPAAFFKVFCFVNADNDLEVRAFILPQDRDAIRNWNGRQFDDWLVSKMEEYDSRPFEDISEDKFEEWRKDAKKEWGGSLLINNQVYQTTIAEIEELTGLKFPPEVAAANPLLYNDDAQLAIEFGIKSFPERIPVNSEEELIALAQPRKWMRDDDVDVFIIAAHPRPLRGSEKWLSVQNMEPEMKNLDGWKILDNKGKSTSLQGELQPGQSLTLDEAGLGDIKLGSDNVILTLWDEKGSRIDRVRYTKREADSRRAVFFRMRISAI